MDKKRMAKMLVDTTMLVLLFLLMGYHVFDGLSHEILGVSLFLMAVLHNVLNFKWYGALFKGRYTPRRTLLTIINLLLVIAILTMIVSAVLVSRKVFAFAEIRGDMLGRRLHLSTSHWFFILMDIHLGFHWSSIMRMFASEKKAGRGMIIALRLMAIAIAGYGVYASFARDFATHLFLLNDYTFWDYSKPAILFFHDLFAIMALYMCATHYLLKLPCFTRKADLT